MSDRKVLVSSTSRNRVAIRTSGGGGSGSGISQFSGLLDVDASGAETNEVPVYDGALSKYVVKVIPRIDGGTF
jgi:hypothetical protein